MISSKTVLGQFPEEMNEAIANNAGLFLSSFNPEEELNAETIRSNILFATSGDITSSCVFTYSDWGEDVNGMPAGTKEMLQVESAECLLAGTALTVTRDTIDRLFPHTDVEDLASGVTKVTPRMDIKDSDFKDVWYVVPYGTTDGFIAVHLKDALNSSGFSWTAVDKSKSTFPFSFRGYPSIDNPREIPFDYYMKKSSEAETETIVPTAE